MIDEKNRNLSKKTIIEFANITSSESPAPGGGSISAYCGALGVSLAVMVANLSAHKRGWDDKWEYYSKYGEKGMLLQSQLLDLVDEDTDAFNSIMNAFSLPKDTDEEKKIRNNQIQIATKNAIEVPFRIMKICFDSQPNQWLRLNEIIEERNPKKIGLNFSKYFNILLVFASMMVIL